MGMYPQRIINSFELRKNGANVVIVGLERGEVNYIGCKCQSETIVQAFNDISVDDFDAVYVTDAFSFALKDGPCNEVCVYDFLRSFAATIAAVGRGAALLLEAGVMSGKTLAEGIAHDQSVTSHAVGLNQDGVVLTAVLNSQRNLNRSFVAKLAAQ